jgi:hypothetical protein
LIGQPVEPITPVHDISSCTDESKGVLLFFIEKILNHLNLWPYASHAPPPGAVA